MYTYQSLFFVSFCRQIQSAENVTSAKKEHLDYIMIMQVVVQPVSALAEVLSVLRQVLRGVT